MAYYEDRSYYPQDRRARPASYAADFYDDPRYARHDRELYPYRGSEDSVEEIQREYPPGEDYIERERGYTSGRRPVYYDTVRRASSVSGYDPYEGAYPRSHHRRSRYDDHRSHRSRYSPSPSPSPPRHRRRKSFSQQALGALGLGSTASLSRHSDHGYDSYSRHGRSYSTSSRSRSRSRSRDRDRKSHHRQRSQQRIAQAARAALISGAVEAFRSRKEPGPWTGEKGKRILTAAVTAAGTDGLIDKDPKKHSKRHLVESTLTGLAANHFLNGSRSKSRGRDKDGRRRSRSSSGFKNIAATGALAAAGKEIYKRFSRSRSQHRGRRDSDDDDDDYHHGSKRRSKSVSDYLSKGIASLGLGEEGRDRSRSRGGHDDRRERRRHRGSRYSEYSDSDADSDDYSRDPRRGRGSREVGQHRSKNDNKHTPKVPPGASRGLDGHRFSKSDAHSSSESDSDIGDSSDEREKRKKLKHDMLLTGGLATIATIHAAHGVYKGIEGRKKRLRELEEGKISPEEARKRRMKANVKDTVSIGLAALGIKGAYGEWQEVREKREEHKHFQDECAKHAVKREQRRRAHSQGPSRSRWPYEIEYPPSQDRLSHAKTIAYHDENPYRATVEDPRIEY
ncbi:hypothetical protein N7495_005630 [Penicillium taxi]|uniref:uncharacterized protein n=1 Tax=Penicillium taxi TaxID=168475 RepID=UPI0025455452|nr:uncharacterized protein N7495_005630 [Penicillium taxi]KAJ5893939.1 hypothetical protein N7495_005630 [Penicillium taxi]